jgi:hypothetical protein
MIIPVPEDITFQISRRALEIVKQTAPKKTGKGAAALLATSSEGSIGVIVPEDVIYMYYQDKGTKPYIMYNLAGKTIPIRLANGTVIFRKATAENIGKRKIVSRNEKGQIMTTKIAWRHPGLKALQYIEKGMEQAVSEWVHQLDGDQVFKMLRETDARDLVEAITGS